MILGVKSTPRANFSVWCIFYNFSNALWHREFIPATTKCATMTDDLEIQGQVIFSCLHFLNYYTR